MDGDELKRLAKRVASTISLKLVAPLIKPAIEAILEANARDIPRMSRLRALEATVDFINDEMREVQSFPESSALLDHVLTMLKQPAGLVCEFGVFRGRSINFIASRLQQHTIHGFDSFEGLPEDWIDGLSRGAFKVDALPCVASNVNLIKGWFDKTLSPFLESHPGDALFLHIDSDLYSSAKTIFDTFAPRIKAGTIIAFDEYFNYPGWQHGEYKAFQESVAKYGWQYKYLGYTPRTEQVALQIMGVRSKL
jgi:predicted O-methyltransferase YrrM